LSLAEAQVHLHDCIASRFIYSCHIQRTCMQCCQCRSCSSKWRILCLYNSGIHWPYNDAILAHPLSLSLSMHFENARKFDALPKISR